MKSWNIKENAKLAFLRNFEYPIKIWNIQINEKGVGNIPNC